MTKLSREEIFEEAVKEIAYFLNFKLKKEIKELLGPIYADLGEIHWQTERTADRLSAPISMEVIDTSFTDEIGALKDEDESTFIEAFTKWEQEEQARGE